MLEIADFLSQDDCLTLIKMIDANYRPSTVSEDQTGTDLISRYRTSSTCNFDPHHPLINTLHQRIAQFLDIDIKKGESLEGQFYESGGFYRGHYDYFTGTSYQMHCQSSGNRTHTLMIYLNDDFSGGGTEFIRLHKTISPSAGKALMWENCKHGVLQEQTLHEGMDVLEGKKYIITSWWREHEWNGHEDARLWANSVTTHTHKTTIPRLSETGFKVMPCPAQTWSLIQEVYSLLKDKKVVEDFDGKAHFIVGGESELLPMTHLPAISALIQQQLQPIHEEFCGAKIAPSAIYGIRSYLPGATLRPHTDRVATHHISAIIVVDKDLADDTGKKPTNDDWPLDIQAHDGQWHKVYAKVGDIILYESAICEHGRKAPFAGRYFRNLFVHYKLL
jgi:prolyl 4-hydroxylase